MTRLFLCIGICIWMQSLKYNTPLVKTIVLNRYLGDEQVFGGLHERLEFLTFSLLIFCHSTFCKEKKKKLKINNLLGLSSTQWVPRGYSNRCKYVPTLQIFTPWKLRGLGIAGCLQGKLALSMEKSCKNCGKTPWWLLDL